MKRKQPSLGGKLFNLIKILLLAALILHVVYLILLRWVDPPITLTQLGSILDGEGLDRESIDLEQISPYAVLAVIAAEDQLFLEHGGFDIDSIERAIEHNAEPGARLRGASTISQQVAKNVFLWQERSWLRKGLEAYFTFVIELVWSKKRIVEVYLNVIETGPGTFGIEAAAQRYFGKQARDLSRLEAAQIASCLPNPREHTVRPLSARVRNKSKWVLEQMDVLQKKPKIADLITRGMKP